ncbi:MAG: pyridoxal phosphate-dependent aminotransferase [Oscillospiraceae bacterium]
MISKKMQSLAMAGSAIRAMFEEGNRLASVYGAENVFDFSIGNPNFAAPDEVKKAAFDILESYESIDIHGYMSNSGYEEVRDAVAKSINGRFGTAFTKGNLIMTVGAAGGLNIILKTLLNPGEEVIVISPYFLEYGNYIKNYDGVVVTVPARPSDFQLDTEALSKAITPKTKAVIINSPNNPTGVIYSEETLVRLASVLKAREAEFGTSIYILSDEPYRELAYENIAVPFIIKYYENTVVAYSWSKSLSLPGERIGYLLLPSEMDDFQLIYDCACIASRIMGFVNAPSLFQRIVARCLDAKTDIGAYDLNRRILYNGLTDCGFECVNPQGTFYLWVKSPVPDDTEFLQEAKKYNILMVPGKSFACPGYVRIAYCASKEKIERSLPAFKKLAEAYGLKKKKD